MDLVTLRKLHKEIQKAIEPVLAKHNVKLSQSNARAYAAFAKLSIKLDECGDDADRRNWEQFCSRFNLPATLFGKTVRISGGEYKVVGLNARKRKKPVIVEDKNGERYVARPEHVKGF